MGETPLQPACMFGGSFRGTARDKNYRGIAEMGGDEHKLAFVRSFGIPRDVAVALHERWRRIHFLHKCLHDLGILTYVRISSENMCEEFTHLVLTMYLWCLLNLFPLSYFLQHLSTQ